MQPADLFTSSTSSIMNERAWPGPGNCPLLGLDWTLSDQKTDWTEKNDYEVITTAKSIHCCSGLKGQQAEAFYTC